MSLLVLTLALSLTGCGGDSGGSTTTPTPTPTPAPALPTSADIDVEILGSGAATSGQGNAVIFILEIVESGGLGANINFIRVDVFRATGEFVERSEVGAGEITRQTGTNRLLANETRELTVVMGFRATVKSGRTITLTVGMTDDQGNNHDFTTTFTFS